jgi:dCTP deaminase
LTGFWSTETLKQRIPADHIVFPYHASQIHNCSYELRLGSEVYVTSEDSRTKRKLGIGEQVRIPPGQFANLLTEEFIHMPADALGLLSAKFTWKQRGLVNVSGFHVDPGYRGRILFSVYNAGTTPVVVERGDSLFLLWCCSLDQTTNDTYKKPARLGITSGDVSQLQGEAATPQALASRVDALEGLVRICKWVLALIVTGIVGTLITIWLTALLVDDDSAGSTGSGKNADTTQTTDGPTTTAPTSTASTLPPP